MLAGTFTAATAVAQTEEEIDKTVEELKTIFADVIDLVSEGQFRQASGELNWADEAIDKLGRNKELTFFPDELGDFKGEAPSVQDVMGMRMTERVYRNGAQRVSVKLTDAEVGGGALGALGALAALGMSQAGSKTRVQRRPVADMTQGRNVNYLVNLNNGGSLNFESSDTAKEVVYSLVELFPIRDLDNYRKIEE